MILDTLTYYDRTRWGSGPWDAEPDRVIWIDPASTLLCVAWRGPSGHWCGYVGVPPTHPAYGLDADTLDVGAHGGVNYAAPPSAFFAAYPVVPLLPPGYDDLWFLGFDCRHSDDLVPACREVYALIAHMQSHDLPAWRLPLPAYRTLVYVQAECARLAAQLALLPWLVQHAAPPGSLCEACLDAPAVVVQAVLWADEAGLCRACAVEQRCDARNPRLKEAL